MMRLATVTAAFILIAFALPASAGDRDAIDRAVTDNPHRSAEQKARDIYRHPAQTLDFFGITPNMTVAEPFPGWYTEILGALLHDTGTYLALELSPDVFKDEDRRKRRQAWPESFLGAKGHLLGEKRDARFILTEDGFAPENSVDAVLAFRAFHGWVYNGHADAILAEFFKALKPGGVLGIVQHRENEDSANTPENRRGYLKESFVIETVKRAGFVLAEKSEINANPKDTKDYEIGVWALPPVLRVSDNEDRNAHIAIGESDRMTLKFIKPQ